jgi:hypothetical protein
LLTPTSTPIQAIIPIREDERYFDDLFSGVLQLRDTLLAETKSIVRCLSKLGDDISRNTSPFQHPKELKAWQALLKRYSESRILSQSYHRGMRVEDFAITLQEVIVNLRSHQAATLPEAQFFVNSGSILASFWTIHYRILTSWRLFAKHGCQLRRILEEFEARTGLRCV